MKKVKIGFWLILIAFLVLVGYQNKAFFLQRHTFDINVWVTAPYKTAEIYNAVLFGACCVAGLVLAYLSSLFERFKANKTTQVTAPVPDEPQAEDEDTVSASAAG